MEIKHKTLGFLWPNDQPNYVHRVRVIGLSKSAIQFSTPQSPDSLVSTESFNIIITKDNFLKNWTFEQLDESKSVRVYSEGEDGISAIGQDIIVEAVLTHLDGSITRTGTRFNDFGTIPFHDLAKETDQDKLIEHNNRLVELGFQLMVPFKDRSLYRNGAFYFTYVPSVTNYGVSFFNQV